MVIDLPGMRRRTLGAHKAYEVREFVKLLRVLKTTPHIASKNASYSMIDQRTTRYPGYEVSQRKRKRVDQIFGGLKTIGLMRKTRHRGVERVRWMLTVAATTSPATG